MTDRDPLAAALTKTFTADTCKQLADYLTVGLDTRDPRAPLIRRLRDALDTAATPRPVPTTRHRLDDARTCDALCRDIEVERDDLRIQTGRLEADNRAMMRDRDQAIAERDAARQLNNQLGETIGRKQDTINARAAELGAAGDVLAVVRDAAERIDRALAVYDTTPGEGSVTITLDNSAGTFTPRHPGDALADALRNAYTTGQLGLLHERVVDLLDDDTPREDPMGRLLDVLFAARHKPTPPALGSLPPRAQDGIRPAAWEQQAIDAAHTALADAWTHLAEDDVYTEQVAITAVRAIIDAGLAGDGGRCRKCGTTYPRTLPAGQDPLCWGCVSEEQVGLDEPAARAQDEPDSDARRLLDQAIGIALPLAGGRVAELLDALRCELVRVDAKRAEKAEG